MSDATTSPIAGVALITGAGQGVGLGIAKVLARGGCRVALSDLDPELARNAADRLAAEGGETFGLKLDVSRVEDWEHAIAAVIKRWGRLDMLVNNAGISPRGTAESTDEALWERTLATNLKGPWLGIKACLPHLRESRGTIVNIGSTRSTRPMRGLFVYGVSKAGLLGLTQQVAIDNLDDGITCNMVAPGWVDTPGERLLQAAHGRPEFPAGTRNLIAPEDVGGAVAYLASPAGRRVNGVILYVDAGFHVADDAGLVFLAPGDGRGYT